MWACPPAADTPSPLSWGHPAWGLALGPLGSRMLEPPPAVLSSRTGAGGHVAQDLGEELARDMQAE